MFNAFFLTTYLGAYLRTLIQGLAAEQEQALLLELVPQGDADCVSLHTQPARHLIQTRCPRL